MAKEIIGVVLAAGENAQMKSDIARANFPVLGKPMASYVLDALNGLGSAKNAMVIKEGYEDIENAFEDKAEFVYQNEAIGTFDAVKKARSFFDNTSSYVFVLPADAPLIDVQTLKSALEYHEKFKNEVTVITAIVDNPDGYGRVIRNSVGDVVSIVEQKDANQSELDINEVNSSMYIFNSEALSYALDNYDMLTGEQDKNNLIHSIEVLIKTGRRVGAYDADDADAILGINDRIQLFEVEAIMRSKINMEHMRNGVTIMAPATTYIEPGVIIGQDTVIEPNVHLRAGTVIGKNVKVGANSIVTNCKIHDGVDILNSVMVDSEVCEGAHIGPFAYLRPNSKIGKNVKIGDFVEIKNASLDEGTKVSHLTYVGDSDVGKKVNFGCGCVTVNYDGKKKYRTTIGDNAFIGCNTNLVSPVTVKDNAYIAAGSTITDEVPESALAIARSRQINKLDWKDRRKQDK